MRKKKLLRLVAWACVPVAFAIFIALSYAIAVQSDALPFLGANEQRWWLAFATALMVGGTCLAVANWRDKFWRVIGPVGYVLAMALVLILIHLSLACAYGDCL